jgi:Tol biopolymer transport system component
MAEPFDPKTLSVTGEAVPIAENVGAVLSAGFFSVSEAGILVYQTSKTAPPLPSGQRQTLAWIDRAGKQLETLRSPGDIADVELSPDRTKFAYTLWGNTSTNRDIWIYDIARQLSSRFTFDPAVERYPIGSPNGKSIIYISTKRDKPDLYRRATDLTGVEEMLWEGSGLKQPSAATSWSPDGQFVLVNAYSPTGKARGHIWKLPLTAEPHGESLKPEPFLDTGSFTEIDGKFSPDGHWVAYSSNESQRIEIYVTPFPGPGGKRQISVDGGTNPRWSADGKEIFYVDLNSTLQAAEINNKGGTIEVGQVRPVVRGIINQRGYLFDVSKDGTRILTHVLTGAQSREPAPSEPLTLISNWPALLKK